jgi:hypothetical protein
MTMRAWLLLLMALHALCAGTSWAQTAGGRGSSGGARGGDWRAPPPVRTPPPVVTVPIPTSSQVHEVEPGQVLLLSRDFRITRQVLGILQAETIVPVATARLRTLGWDLALFQFADHAAALERLLQWRQRFPQVSVDLNHLYQAQSDMQGREYALRMLDLPQQTASAKGMGVRMGMLDTRVENTDWLRQATLTRRPFLNDTSARQPDVPASPAHGTAIASLVASVAPQVRLYAAEVMAARGDRTVTNSYRLIQGVDWLLGHQVRAINMSLAGRPDVNLATTVDELMRRDVVVIAAAGNQGHGAPPAYPAAYAVAHAGMLAVTAVDVQGQLYDQANRGGYVSAAAPGVQIWVPAAGAMGARYVSGTSYASAYATGAVARWLATYPGQSASTATRRLRDTARDLGPTGRDESFGDGLLQVNAALRR